MARIKKRGATGAARNFITRSQAVKKLQVTLADFRRLCIFKGIYPREPRHKRKANKGSTAPTTFYYHKDIQYLMHEPVLDKFREHKTFAKKLQRALGRGEITDAQRLEKKRPKYTLDHVIKERYPTFLDAVRDIDDPLNMLFLFANMPATDAVSHRVVSQAEKLCNQWLAYVAKERVLKKVFVSIKGVYYQASVKGQDIRWLVPFKFPTNIPTDVDFRIMLTFLEFYSTLIHFVLFRLYNEANLIYPPIIDIEQLKSIGGLSSYVLKTKEGNSLLPQASKVNSSEKAATELSGAEITKAIQADADEEDEIVDEENVEEIELDKFEATNKTAGDLLVQPTKFASPSSVLFSKFVFYVGREVSLDILELCIVACGAVIVSEIALDNLKINQPEEFAKLDLSHITHQIVDRPKLAEKVAGRTYVQPQWIFDCINKMEILPVNQYAPGEVLPPHLSPWGDESGYNPEVGDVIEEEEEDESDSEDEVDVEDEEEEEEDEDIKAQRELELEAAGVKYANVAKEDAKKSKKQGKKRANEAEEEKDLKKIMMSNKQRKMYNKVQGGLDKEANRQKELTKKRKKIEKTKAQLSK